MTARGGSDALAELRIISLELVQVDHMMPQVTVLELLPTQSNAGRPRFVMSTGTDDGAAAGRCKQLGARHGLLEPLPAAVLRHLAKRAVAPDLAAPVWPFARGPK